MSRIYDTMWFENHWELEQLAQSYYIFMHIFAKPTAGWYKIEGYLIFEKITL